MIVSLLNEMAIARNFRKNVGLEDLENYAKKHNLLWNYKVNDKEYYWIDVNVFTEFICDSDAFNNVVLISKRIEKFFKSSIPTFCEKSSISEIVFSDKISSELENYLNKFQESLNDLKEYTTAVAEAIDEFNCSLQGIDPVKERLNVWLKRTTKYSEDSSHFPFSKIQGSSRHVFNSKIRDRLNSELLCDIKVNNFFEIVSVYYHISNITKYYKTSGDPYNRLNTDADYKYQYVAAQVLLDVMKECRDYDNVICAGLATTDRNGRKLMFYKKLNSSIEVADNFEFILNYSLIANSEDPNEIQIEIWIE